MRKLKLQVQMSIDGFIAGQNGEMDWMVWDWDDEIKKYVSEITEPVDCILMGKNLAAGFIPYWKNVASNPDDLQYQFGKKMTDTPKVVFTKTLDKSEWNNTVLAKGDLIEEVNNLKQQNGKDIIVYGGATFVSSLIKAGLIDEYNLFVNPTAIGAGMPIFKELDMKQNFTLKKAIAFECGIALLQYEKK
ncbi:MAG: dihydrofolate reductase family protein [Ignavibacteriaceae bacterium]|jgi:dihydrofolate reductase